VALAGVVHRLFWLLYRKQYIFALMVFALAGLATTVGR
jgi:hypothetical protein